MSIGNPDSDLIILRLRQVKAKTGLSRSSLYAKIAVKEFPPPIKLGSANNARASGWLLSEIDSWIKARIAASRGGDNSVPKNQPGKP